MAHLIKYYPTSSLLYSKNSYPNDFAFVGLTKIPSHVYKISITQFIAAVATLNFIPVCTRKMCA